MTQRLMQVTKSKVSEEQRDIRRGRGCVYSQSKMCIQASALNHLTQHRVLIISTEMTGLKRSRDVSDNLKLQHSMGTNFGVRVYIRTLYSSQ